MSSALYGFAYEYVIAPAIISAFRVLALTGNKKVKAGLEMRKSKTDLAPWQQGRSNTRPVWIHCASGEFEYAKPVIVAIKALSPAQKILVTYFSPSVRGAVEKFPGIDFHSPAPLERRKDLQDLIDHHRPAALIIARTDTWPLMLKTAKRNKIPTLLFSATLSADAGRIKPAMRGFSRWVFSFLDQIFCVTEEDQALFTELGFGRITHVAGDTRFDQVIARLRNPKPLKPIFDSDVDRTKIFVAGSTWDEDEAELLPLIAEAKGEVHFVIAPHEPTKEHLEKLEEKLKALEMTSVRYSELTDRTRADVVLVDQVGILAELYQLGAFAFVGGSFRKTVHSVMEPLAAGCFTFIGPLHLNNREAIEFKGIRLPGERDVTCAIEVADRTQWIETLQNLRANMSSEDQDFIRDQINKRSGRSELVAKWAVNAVVRNQLHQTR